eukprot:188828-Rhodomonas_salina.2
MSGTDLAHAATVGFRSLSTTLALGNKGGRIDRQRSPISLRPRYAVSGTDLAYGPIRQRARYAMPSTGLAHSAMLYAYARATRCPVLKKWTGLNGSKSLFAPAA